MSGDYLTIRRSRNRIDFSHLASSDVRELQRAVRHLIFTTVITSLPPDWVTSCNARGFIPTSLVQPTALALDCPQRTDPTLGYNTCNREGTDRGRLLELRDPNSNIQTV